MTHPRTIAGNVQPWEDMAQLGDVWQVERALLRVNELVRAEVEECLRPMP